FHAINQTDAFEKANITHVVTVLRIEAPEKFAKYIHHLIQVDDVADEDLIQYFPKTNAFIAKALAAGGAVYVHCAMGISRSATILAAYLMHSRKISAEDAISVIKSVRPIICPNFGFREQLKLFEEMGCPDSVEDQPIYQRWLFKQDVELSNYVGKAPSNIRFEDELSPQGDGSEGAVVELRCKRCRQSLATSRTFAPHTARVDANGNANPQPCAHHFLEPLLWMKPELSKGAVSGKLECPKCESKVGSYAWQGLKCSCGSWVVPGISIARGKVDEVKVVSHL
ncbi:protein-tyrosine phosphatase-like protein, partial [Peziza echinospora]